MHASRGFFLDMGTVSLERQLWMECDILKLQWTCFYGWRDPVRIQTQAILTPYRHTHSPNLKSVFNAVSQMKKITPKKSLAARTVMAMTAKEIRIEQSERRLYAILDRQTRLIEGLMKAVKPDDLEEDLQKNLKETNSMLDDCFWQFLGPLEVGDQVVSAYDAKMQEGTIISIQKESSHKDYGSAVVEFQGESEKTMDVCELVKVRGPVLLGDTVVPGPN